MHLKLEQPNNCIQYHHLSQREPVRLRRFWCGDIPFVAYQFNSGEIAMSQTQFLPALSTVLSKIVDNFISYNHLPVVEAILPNHSHAILYPLPTVVALWSHLLSLSKLPERKELLMALKAGITVLEDSQLMPIEPNTSKPTTEPTPTTLAKTINLPIDNFLIPVLLSDNTIYISDHEGLSIINASTRWLVEINSAQKKARVLRSNGFSFKEKTLFYRKTKIFQTQARIGSDWIILWSYFAGKGNTKAVSLLQNLALLGLENRIRHLLSNNQCSLSPDK